MKSIRLTCTLPIDVKHGAVEGSEWHNCKDHVTSYNKKGMMVKSPEGIFVALKGEYIVIGEGE